MFAIRQILASTIIFAAVPPAVVRAAETVQYVGGTVKSIPVNSVGAFNFADAKELSFVYNGAIYRLPYEQISGTDIEKADVRRVMHIFPAMSPIASHRKQTLIVNYTDASGTAGTLNFELAAYRAVEVQETIAAKKAPAPSVLAGSPNGWWGDKVWKTTRNKAAWDAQEAQAAQAAQTAAAQPAPVAPGGTK